MSIFHGLGRALRWLRDRQSKRQYQIADTAGITKAMLSAYETGKQKPSLDTLEKILAALDCDLNDLHNALQIINERPEAIRRAGEPRQDGPELASGEPVTLDLYRILGITRKLHEQEERALTEMLGGYYRWIRFLHSFVQSAAGEIPRNDEPR